MKIIKLQCKNINTEYEEWEDLNHSKANVVFSSVQKNPSNIFHLGCSQWDSQYTKWFSIPNIWEETCQWKSLKRHHCRLCCLTTVRASLWVWSLEIHVYTQSTSGRLSCLLQLWRIHKPPAWLTEAPAQLNTIPFSKTLLPHKARKHFISVCENWGMRKTEL